MGWGAPHCVLIYSAGYLNFLHVQQQACTGVRGTHWCDNTVPATVTWSLEQRVTHTVRRRRARTGMHLRRGGVSEGPPLAWGAQGNCAERAREGDALKDQPAGEQEPRQTLPLMKQPGVKRAGQTMFVPFQIILFGKSFEYKEEWKSHKRKGLWGLYLPQLGIYTFSWGQWGATEELKHGVDLISYALYKKMNTVVVWRIDWILW